MSSDRSRMAIGCDDAVERLHDTLTAGVTGAGRALVIRRTERGTAISTDDAPGIRTVTAHAAFPVRRSILRGGAQIGAHEAAIR